jgi:UDP-N-acetylglucosamine 2-epimerase (non-hydrolysing)
MPGNAEAVAVHPHKLALPLIVGTRPEAIKLVPVILALRESQSFHPIVISTGQHHEMVSEVFALAGIATDVELWVGGFRSRLNERVTQVMQRFEDFCNEWFGADGSEPAPRDVVLRGDFPAAVLVHGDTSSAFAAALAAFHLRIPVMHVEAGLRTRGLNLTPFPEELNRQLISCIACFHFAPTITNHENLVRERIPTNQVFVTGNTGIDALHWATSLDVEYENPELERLHASDRRIVVVTVHRRENWGAPLDAIAAGVAALATEEPDIEFVLPMHPNPRVREQLRDPLEPLANVHLIEPLGYARFARLLARCDLVITDSGGIQEEAPSLDKPVIVTRETTERTEGVDAGTLILAGTDSDRIVKAGRRLLNDPVAYAEVANTRNPYGDGHAAERIVAALEHLLHGGDGPQPFGSGYSRDAVLAAAGYELALHPSQFSAAERGTAEERQADPLFPRSEPPGTFAPADEGERV